MSEDIYEQNGFKNRNHYLKHLSMEYEVSLKTVTILADMLGEGEDFDGLVNSLEDQFIYR